MEWESTVKSDRAAHHDKISVQRKGVYLCQRTEASQPLKKRRARAGDTAQRVKVPVTRSEDLSWILKPHSGEKTALSCDFNIYAVMCTRVHRERINK